jgi:hypothetical protein
MQDELGVEKRVRLMRTLVGKKPLGRQRYRWMDTMSMDLGEIGWGGMD